jgi:hypothetical protein
MNDAPKLYVNGLAIWQTYTFDKGIWSKSPDSLDDNGSWGGNGSTSLAATMPGVNKARYSLYICIRSSISDGPYDIYVQPILTNDETGEKAPFQNEGGLYFFIMGLNPNLGNNTWYVQVFPWFIGYGNWSDPGSYTLSITKGYLKRGTAVGEIPTWDGTVVDIPVTLS